MATAAAATRGRGGHAFSADGAYLILVDCCSSNSSHRISTAFQLAAELLRWPKAVAAQVYRDGCPALPPIPVANKYFATRVHVVLADTTALHAAADDDDSGDACGVSRLLRNFPSAVGCVLVVDASMPPAAMPLHAVPMACLFRVVVGVGGGDVLRERGGVWYDACVASGYEYVPHGDAYEVVPAGVEAHGLLGGDHSGAARLCQVLHNTMWPEASRVPHNNTSSSSRSGGDVAGMRASKRGVTSMNLVAVVSASGVDVVRWLAAACTDCRFFTALSPLQAAGRVGTATGNADDNDRKNNTAALTIANRYYAATLDVFCVHPALCAPVMADLFMAQYADRRPQVAVLCWPPTEAAATGGTNVLMRETALEQQQQQLPLPLIVDQLRRWGAADCVIVADGESSLSPFEAQYCMEQSIEVICTSVDDAATQGDACEVGPTGANRLAEVLHSVEWPERTAIPTLRPAKATNGVLLWACAPTAAAEESLLHEALAACLPDSSSRCTATLLSMQSPGLGAPVMTTGVRNKYFEATAGIYCFGGARSAVMLECEPTIEQLRAFGVVVLVTTAEAVREAAMRSRVGAALEKCGAAQRAAALGSGCSSSSLILEDEQQGAEMTRRLCVAAEASVEHLWYVVDGDGSNDAFITSVEELLLQLHREEELEGDDEAGDASCDDAAGGAALPAEGDDDNSSITGEMFAWTPVEVVYGVGGEGIGAARLQEVLQQHVWPNRKMLHGTSKSTTLVRETNEESRKEAVEDAVEVAVPPVAGCELPPEYLVDPLTQKSERVAALAVTSGAPLDEQQQEQLVQWMDRMKQHGHRLSRALRQQQAEVLANKLGEHLGAVGEP